MRSATAMKKSWPSWDIDLSGLLEGSVRSRSVGGATGSGGSIDVQKDKSDGKPARRCTVSFAPLPPRPFRRSSSGRASDGPPPPPPFPRVESDPSLRKLGMPRPGGKGDARTKSKRPPRRGNGAKEETSGGRGFRVDYSLGDAVRRPSHMISHPTPELALRAADSLRKHDFAFVKRSDGSFTYAILAFRSIEAPEGDDCGRGSPASLEERMTFVTGGHGATKVLRRDQWAESVRPASPRGWAPPSRGKRPPAARANKDRAGGDGGWAPPCVISFVPLDADAEDDDRSLLPVD